MRRGKAKKALSAADERELERRMKRAMVAGSAVGREMVVSLSDDAELKALNKQYAGEDHATDVLSFSLEEGPPTPLTIILGDVVISVEMAARQAKTHKHSLVDEITHLAVHGMAHLLGYDHATPEDEKAMFEWEAKLRIEAVAKRAPVRQKKPRLPKKNAPWPRRG